MPRLNQLGQAAMGVGAGPCSVDGRLVLPVGGGPAQWFANDVLLVNSNVDGPWQVLAVFVGDPTQRSVMRLTGANDLVAAGAGLWLGWTALEGVFGTVTLPLAGVVAAGFDGTLAYCPNYQTGIGVVLRAPGGQETAIPTAVPLGLGFFQVLSATSAVWTDFHTGLTTFGRPAFTAALPVGRCRVARVRGEDWLVYWSEGTGLVAQVDGALDGYILETAPTAFNHDAVMVHGPSGEELLVAWSLTAGEGPGDLVRVQVDRSAPRVHLPPVDPDPPIIVVPPEPEPGPEPPEPTPGPEPEPEPEPMEPKIVVFQAGVYVARLVPSPGPSPDVPWPGWFPVAFDQNPVDDFARWELSQPEPGVNKFKAVNIGHPGSILSLDFTQFGGSVCKGVYATPAGGAWGQHEQLLGWQLGAGGPETIFVRQLGGTLSIGLAVVTL